MALLLNCVNQHGVGGKERSAEPLRCEPPSLVRVVHQHQETSMKRALAATVALTLLGGAAVAQTTVTTTDTTGSVEIAPAQRTVIKKYVTEQRAAPVRLKERVTVGSTVPADVEFRTLPDTIVAENPRLKGYSYFSTGEDTYIVDPSSRKVITTID
jgi:hypothetical protein